MAADRVISVREHENEAGEDRRATERMNVLTVPVELVLGNESQQG